LFLKNGRSKGIAAVLTAIKESGAEWNEVFNYDPVKESFPEYKTFKSAIKELRSEMATVVQATGKIAIIIDELDRCKPTFAVQTLEIVKHLFNVPGIVFIFSLDLTQLQHCIKTGYGNEFDAIGYLERFFDYTSLLPHGDQKLLFFKTAEEFGLSTDTENMETYFTICNEFELSIRETRAVCSSFYYLQKYELENYPPLAKQLYFYLLAMKYKKPDQVTQAITATAEAQALRTEIMMHYPPVFANGNYDQNPFISVFNANPIIRDYADFRLINTVNGKYSDSETYKIVGTQPPLIDSVKRSNLSNIKGFSLSYVIYDKDFESAELFNLRVLEYLYRKVELYDTKIDN